jgi:circadian clock protein KaiC
MSDKTQSLRSQQRLSTGIAGLDLILKGGLLRSRVYVLLGRPGAGKTVFANQLCFHHVASGGQAVYVSLLAEAHGHLFNNLDALTFFDRNQIGDAIHYFNGVADFKKDGLPGLFQLLRKLVLDYRPSFLVLDTLLFTEALTDTRVDFRNFMGDLNVLLDAAGCTALLLSYPALSFVSYAHAINAD